MARLRHICLMIWTWLMLFSCISWTQTTTGNLEGRIFDEFDAPVPGVNVTATSPSLQGIRGAVSDDQGNYHLFGLPVGDYTVRIVHVAYNTVIQEKVRVQLGRTTFLGLTKLENRTIESEEVTVFANRVVDMSSTTSGTNLNSSSFRNLPIERNYRSIANLAPQANLSYYGDEVNMVGSTGPENVYYIDGINVTDPYQGATSTNLPYNFVEEIEIKTGGFEAEYGRAMGGIVNVITHSGGNEFESHFFAFLNNNRLTGEPQRGVIASDEGDFRKYDIGLSIGGPIKKNRLWFFGAYNPNFEKEDVNLPGLGIKQDKRTTHIFAGKITWRASTATNLTVNLFGDISRRDFLEPFWSGVFAPPSRLENIDPISGRSEDGGINHSITGRHLLGNSLLIEGSAARVERKANRLPATELGKAEPILIDYTSGVTYSGGFGTTREQLNRRSAASLSATLFASRHTFKAGVEYEDNFLRLDTHVTPPGIVERHDPNNYTAIYYDLGYKVRNKVLTLYLQDSWQLNQEIRINAGLRLDAQYLIGATGDVAQSITDQYQPRIGFILTPEESQSNKIYGSYGRFYEQLPTEFAGHFGGLSNGVLFYSHNPIEDPANPEEDLDLSTTPLKNVRGLRGEHFDEFILGYERIIKGKIRLAIRGIRRTLREVIETGYDLDRQVFIFGNPGKGPTSYMPEMHRDYRALEISLQKSRDDRFYFITSYVLSSNHGNYEGFYDTSQGTGFTRPNSLGWDFDDQFQNLTGLLPNDRTHVFKFAGSYRVGSSLSVGGSFFWQSGTPISELGKSFGIGPRTKFLRPRGSLGRTDSIWDLGIRVEYAISVLSNLKTRPKLIFDLLHIGSPRRPVVVDQIHYFGIDDNGNQISPNPNFLFPLAYQPPLTLRLGLEVGF